MAQTTKKELRLAREAAKFTRWQAGEAVGVSEYTIERWQNGETMPTPDDVDRLQTLYQCDGLWTGWMRSHYDSCRKRLPPYVAPNRMSKLQSIVNLRHEIGDVQQIQDRTERDVLDGDDTAMLGLYVKELRDVLRAVLTALPVIDKKDRQFHN